MLHEFRTFAMRDQHEYYAHQVLNVSSHYAFGDHAKGYRWHVIQVLGQQDEPEFGDSPKAWCMRSRNADAGLIISDRDYQSTNANGTMYPYGPWDYSKVYDKYGFTEYVELKYEKPVYPSSIEIGIPRGMGTITRWV